MNSHLLKVGFDAAALGRKLTGLEVTVYEILKALPDFNLPFEFHIFCRILPEALSRLIDQPNIKIHFSPYSSQILTEQVWLPWKIQNLQLNGTHFPAFAPSLLISEKFILTIHDDVPWQMTSTMSWKGRLYFKIPMQCMASKATAIITDTLYHQKTLQKHLKLSHEPIVIPLAPRAFDMHPVMPMNISIKKPYILCVGSLEPRKNLPLLLEAFINLKEKYQLSHQLIIVGRKAWIENKVFQKLKEYEQQSYIILTDYVKEDQLAWLYQNAAFFVLPSKYEGFGLTPLEAMALGCPVISSNAACLPEVLGKGALFFENNNHHDLIEKMLYIITHHTICKELSKKGQEWVKKYSWNNTTNSLLQLYEKIFV